MELRRYRIGEEPSIWKVYFDATHESIARDYHQDLLNRWAPPDKDMTQWAERLAQKNPFIARNQRRNCWHGGIRAGWIH